MFGKKSDPTPCPNPDGTSLQQRTFDQPPSYCLEDGMSYTAEIVTNHGALTVELFANRTPTTVNNFIFLARYHYFDGVRFHRIIPGFVVQGGDPTGTGSGGPGYRFRDELPEANAYQLGSLAMANAGPNTNGSQFFIISGQSGIRLPPLYSLFGQLTEGFEVLAAIEALGTSSGTPTQDCTIERVTIASTSADDTLGG
ncbi:MAG: peptidylprolyl isomerase [Ferrimicrobium sp.]